MRRVIIFTLLIFSTVVISSEQNESSKNRLQMVMLDLLRDTHSLTEGIFTEDFTLIESSAEKIANHPNPGPEILQQVKQTLGSEMTKFKIHDVTVHKAASSIVELAAKDDMSAILIQYHKMVDGCQSCHNNFKSRISAVLSKN